MAEEKTTKESTPQKSAPEPETTPVQPTRGPVTEQKHPRVTKR